jgi:DNA phosphorothioation-associated putative methyltransferase
MMKKPNNLSSLVRNDIKSLFGSYHKANAIATLLLVSLGHPLVIAETCHNSPMGLNFSDYLLVHISALDDLDPFLRVYEGCASRTIGRLDRFNVIKFPIRQPKISYLFYPDFDTESSYFTNFYENRFKRFTREISKFFFCS